jgi:hypothetical protein
MWVCPECKVKNLAMADVCSVCGALCPDVNKGHHLSDLPEAVGVPRRFSVGTMIIMLSLFGVLFAVLKMLNTDPIVFACIAVFFMGIGVAQTVLFSGKDPRRASFIAGFPLGFVCALGGTFIANWTGGYHQIDGYFCLVFACTLFGGPCGYLAGCLVAGIFLVRERESEEETDQIDDDDEGRNSNEKDE